jgi:hypothetical protein
VIFVSEPETTSSVNSALAEIGFIPDAEKWWRFSLNGIFTRDQVATKVSASSLPASLKEKLGSATWFQATCTQTSRTELEHVFSPVKIVSPETPCFVVSIRPDWAAHFFDIPVGGQTLIDLKDELHLGIEGVYYCSAKNTHLQAPGRILWYVSKGPKNNGSMTIKACSHLEEVVSGKPKELFAKFQHLGVFGWKHVLAAAGGEIDHNLMAFRFRRTERFLREIPLSKFEELDIAQPVNPRRITDAQFAEIYKIGMNLPT